MKIRKIEWRNFSSYGNKKQILEFDENASLVQIVGENGAGKSTLMKILSGVFKKDSGTVIFDGEVILNTTPLESMKRGLSIVLITFIRDSFNNNKSVSIKR